MTFVTPWEWWCSLGEAEQAAWAQAVVTLLGLLVAIAIPTVLEMQRRRAERNDRLARARSMAFRMLPWYRRAAEQLDVTWPEDKVLPDFVVGSREFPEAGQLAGAAIDLLDEYHWFGAEAAVLHRTMELPDRLRDAFYTLVQSRTEFANKRRPDPPIAEALAFKRTVTDGRRNFDAAIAVLECHRAGQAGR